MQVQTLIAPFRFEAQERPDPSEEALGKGDVILRMLAGAICGSDLPPFSGIVSRRPTDLGPFAADVPGFPMHEVVGDVLVSNGTDLEVGQRVVGWARDNNGLAEYLVASAGELWPIGNDAPAVEQVMMQPLACVLYGLQTIGEIAGRRVAVIGQGPLGLLFSHVLKSKGAASVVGIDRIDRSDVASSFGIDEVVATNSDRWARGLSASDRPDIVIDAVGHQVGTLNHAIEAAADKARIFYFGIADDPSYPVDFVKFQRKHLTLSSEVTPTEARRPSLAAAEVYLRDHPGLIAAYTTHVFKLADAQGAYECANVPAEGRLKVAVSIA